MEGHRCTGQPKNYPVVEGCATLTVREYEVCFMHVVKLASAHIAGCQWRAALMRDVCRGKKKVSHVRHIFTAPIARICRGIYPGA